MKLYRKDVRGNMRIYEVELVPVKGAYIIQRRSSRENGAIVDAPPIRVTEGKAGRTLEQQADLEFRAIIRQAMDSGYRADSAMDGGTFRRDANGAVKPQLAKLAPEDPNDPLWNRTMMASTKLRGVRCIIYYDECLDILRSSSRGGKHYDVAAQHIIRDPLLLKLFKEFPELAKSGLDGELYIHGKSEGYISGLSRKKQRLPEHAELTLWVYDVVAPDKTFEQRLKLIKSFEKRLNEEVATGLWGSPSVKFLHHRKVSSYEEAIAFHDEAVSDGFEGAVLRDPRGAYLPGGRDTRMIKLKMFKDAEFKIVGITEGLRKEDVVIVLKTEEGKTFEAKPVGERELREWYVDHVDEIVGKLGTVKYFDISEDGVPVLPIFQMVRYDLD